MSSGEDLLVRVALDLWSGSGDAKVWELVEILDLLKALIYVLQCNPGLICSTNLIMDNPDKVLLRGNILNLNGDNNWVSLTKQIEALWPDGVEAELRQIAIRVRSRLKL